MKFVPVAAIIIIVIVGVAAGIYLYNSQNHPTNGSAPQCSDPDSISSHVYKPSRLVVYNQCIFASGTVGKVRTEADGDYHVQLHLDLQYSNLTNSYNDRDQNGTLVVEIICANPVTQADAISACASYSNTILVPSTGDRIRVSGPYVLDTAHGWTEIHPAYALAYL